MLKTTHVTQIKTEALPFDGGAAQISEETYYLCDPDDVDPLYLEASDEDREKWHKEMVHIIRIESERERIRVAQANMTIKRAFDESWSLLHKLYGDRNGQHECGTGNPNAMGVGLDGNDICVDRGAPALSAICEEEVVV